MIQTTKAKPPRISEPQRERWKRTRRSESSEATEARGWSEQRDGRQRRSRGGRLAQDLPVSYFHKYIQTVKNEDYEAIDYD